jgi:hypothetical protein
LKRKLSEILIILVINQHPACKYPRPALGWLTPFPASETSDRTRPAKQIRSKHPPNIAYHGEGRFEGWVIENHFLLRRARWGPVPRLGRSTGVDRNSNGNHIHRHTINHSAIAHGASRLCTVRNFLDRGRRRVRSIEAVVLLAGVESMFRRCRGFGGFWWRIWWVEKRVRGVCA